MQTIIEFSTNKKLCIEGNLVRVSYDDGFFFLSYLAFGDSDNNLAQALVSGSVKTISVMRDEVSDLIYQHSDEPQDRFLGIISKVDRKVTKFDRKDKPEKLPPFWGN